MRTDKIHIVGGGIAGLCSAFYLTKQGCKVTIVDDNDFTDGTSFGNAGMIVPSHFEPMATPGVISQGLKWILNSKSPFYIKPRLNKDLFQWLWHFYRSATKEHVEKHSSRLYEINERSKWLYKEMVTDEGFACDYDQKGLLMLYKTEKQAEKEFHLAEQAKKLDIEAQVLDYQGLKKLEPQMDLDVIGGVYFPGDAHLYPNHLIAQLIEWLKKSGVEFMTKTKIVDIKTAGSKVVSLVNHKKEVIPVDNVLLSAGSWTANLLKKVGIKMFLQDGKGYSLTLSKPAIRPNIPTILSEAKVAITPMGEDLRIGGTLELSGLSDQINMTRVSGILESVPKYYKNLEIPENATSNIWKGYRPCTPDGLPYIGKSERCENLFVATGHGMMGLSLGAITGKLTAQLVTEQETDVPVDAFALSRF